MVNPAHCSDDEVMRIAHDLATKHGYDAIAFAQDRAERATAIGDELARDIWERVLAAVSVLKAHQF
jgi:hypothetical protein